MEFGYVEAPHKSFPVVFDSPRNRGLKEFAYKRILVCGQGRSGNPWVAPPMGPRSALPSPGPLEQKDTGGLRAVANGVSVGGLSKYANRLQIAPCSGRG